jgi:hypothetical protein
MSIRSILKNGTLQLFIIFETGMGLLVLHNMATHDIVTLVVGWILILFAICMVAHWIYVIKIMKKRIIQKLYMYDKCRCTQCKCNMTTIRETCPNCRNGVHGGK